ncbi:hypothetical protein RUESEDTHA_04110 [Ruegeria sp. THAF57]|uniref:DUF1330 domain-containing protein n=1 Tax=Ruegeria sp. THAF57 TaxID=2744555 RepID=UPI0015DF3459|nr:DUF1330 domain-containing protein [Ruegeria sp. THAF57]CAD0187198.1 hypothetical protein RUESEDTHA_04110 [Ruegeria sp. THAF57]
MKLKLLITSMMLALGLSIHAKAQEAESPVYMVASLRVDDMKPFLNGYVFPVTPMLEQAGAEILVATPQVQLLEGHYSANWSVIVRFPSQAAADGWYQSPEYQAMIPLRQGLTDTDVSTLFFAPQFLMPGQKKLRAGDYTEFRDCDCPIRLVIIPGPIVICTVAVAQRARPTSGARRSNLTPDRKVMTNVAT